MADASGRRAAVVETDDFIVDLAAKRVTTADGRIRLTSTEWHIVELLVRNAGSSSATAAAQEVWGPQYEKETNYLRVHLAQIRGKLEPGPTRPCYFITEARMGDRFEPVRPDRDGRTYDRCSSPTTGPSVHGAPSSTLPACSERGHRDRHQRQRAVREPHG